MSTTALKINGQNLLFMTVPLVKGMAVDIFMADANFEPMGTPSIGASEHSSEEDYHKNLRLQAHAKGQFIPDYSTNPEWNPGYIEEAQIISEITTLKSEEPISPLDHESTF